MSDQPRRTLSLREIELEVENEGREWMRRRLEERLQDEADRANAVFPPEPKEGPASAPKSAAAAQRRGRD